jgi:hypothetical protein
MSPITGWKCYSKKEKSKYKELWMPEPDEAVPEAKTAKGKRLSIAKDKKNKFHLAFAASRMDEVPPEHYLGQFDTLEAAQAAYRIYVSSL